MIKEFIQNEVLLPRLKRNGVLVVYDLNDRYHQLCMELATDKLRVIDASKGSIQSRADAMGALLELGSQNTSLEGLLVYVPAKVPLTDEECQQDPFAAFGACGAVFPDGDGDEFLSLCLKAKADHNTEIRRIFNSNPNPSFAVIDALGGGAGWPTLQALLKVESARDILFAFLAPSESQKEALRESSSWIQEVKALFQSSLGLDLLTHIQKWEAISEELWRFLLFSEFVFDLPVDLPQTLLNVPSADPEARPLVEDLCDRLRNDRRTQDVYIQQAERVENELRLPTLCEYLDDFGLRDTFPFEERVCFDQAVDALKRKNVEWLDRILKRHTESVWGGIGENQIRWGLLESATSLVESCRDAEARLQDHVRSQEEFADYYVISLRDVDRYQREFEQAIGDFIADSGQGEKQIIDLGRTTYRKLIDKVQNIFIKHLEKFGWPIHSWLSNSEVFDRLVAPKLKESGRRVALILIDALRYELGVELVKQLGDEGQVEIKPACAQMPTVTEVGMASLLPGADLGLQLVREDDKMVPSLEDQRLSNVTQRMNVLQKCYGQRFAERKLMDFVRKREKIAETVELLVIRSNEIDKDFESNPEVAPSLISRTVQSVLIAVRKLRDEGFLDVLILTDHGFFLNTAIESGDVCTKPAGSWINVHERMLLGDGSGDAANVVLAKEKLGIRGDFNQVAIPYSMVAYRSNQCYFHGGASLQEAIVPVITLQMKSFEKQVSSQLTTLLSYRRGSTKITTRLPVVEVTVAGQGGLFASSESLEILLEAYNLQGEVVGEAKLGGLVNPATGTLTVQPGETVQVTMKMDLEFEGKFFIRTLDPATRAALGEQLNLETDYMV